MPFTCWLTLPAFCVLFNHTGIELRALSICFAIKLYPQPSFFKKMYCSLMVISRDHFLNVY